MFCLTDSNHNEFYTGVFRYFLENVMGRATTNVIQNQVPVSVSVLDSITSFTKKR